MNIEKIVNKYGHKPSDITSIYYGGNNCCRCGCKGNYAECGTPTFKRYLNMIAKATLVGEAEFNTTSFDWLNLPIDNSTDIGKCFCLYFNED